MCTRTEGAGLASNSRGYYTRTCGDTTPHVLVILIKYLTFAKENPNSTKTKNAWVYKSGELKLMKNNPTQRPPPEIVKLGGTEREYIAVQRAAPWPDWMAIRGVLDPWLDPGNLSSSISLGKFRTMSVCGQKHQSCL